MTSRPDPPELEGRLLLADPSLRDGSFHKSVIFLGDHSASEGAFGLVLNQPSGKKVGDLITEPEFHSLADIPVHFGGPVSRDQLTFAAFWKRDHDLGFACRISTREAADFLEQPGTLVRAFAGYSGWSKGQLEEELEQQAWTVAAPAANLVSLSHDITLWKALMRAQSPYHRILAEAPNEILSN